MNKIILMGRLVADPETREVGEHKICDFKIAVNRRFKKDEADFIAVNAWNKTGEFVTEYFNKGSMIALTGRLEIQTWKDNDGNFQSKAVVIADEVYFTSSKNDATNSENSKKEQAPKKASNNNQDPLPF
jgi:single-strand DNA-binding protein